MNILEATKRYEAWLISNSLINQKHLILKHEIMKADIFAFLRATFYRWIQLWLDLCPDLNSAPTVLAVADLHVENFGTWRDREGRLVWGINDFDEAFPLPYTNDLVRLAASATLAFFEGQLSVKPKDATDAILTGYRSGLDSGGRPFVLEEDHKSLRAMALGSLRNPRRFWRKLLSQERVKGTLPRTVSKIFDEIMPQSKKPHQFYSRVAGLGALGRLRIVAVAECSGGNIAREIKALAPSACAWGRNGTTKGSLYEKVVRKAIRSPDPFLQITESWLVHRLSPHCCRIELGEIPERRDEYRLLHAMGAETANIHLGSSDQIAAIKRDLGKRKGSWLRDAAKVMVEATTRDWKEWKIG